MQLFRVIQIGWEGTKTQAGIQSNRLGLEIRSGDHQPHQLVTICAGELHHDFDIGVQLCNSAGSLRAVREHVRPQPDEYQHTDETKKTKEDFLGRLH